MTEPLLRVQNLVKQFPISGGLLGRVVDRVHAVDGVSFDLAAGETLGVVGESGCGKSTTGRCILRLIEPTSGEVWFEGKSVTKSSKEELRALARDKRGATAVEYGLILALIFIAIVVAVSNAANSTIYMWNNVANRVVNT